MPRGRSKPPQAVTRLRHDTDVTMVAPRCGQFKLVQGTVVHGYEYVRPLDVSMWWVKLWNGWHRCLKIGRADLVRDYVSANAPGPKEAPPRTED